MKYAMACNYDIYEHFQDFLVDHEFPGFQARAA